MKESRENYVDLKGYNTTIGIEAMIEYAYTGILNLTFDNLVYILDAASHLQISDALNLINDYLIKNCSYKNCVNILKLADRFALNQVEDNLNDYLAKNFINIYQNAYEQFIQLTHEQLIQQLQSSNLQTCSEIDLFLIVCKWLNADREKRLEYASKILKHIRFMTISSYELSDYVEKYDFMHSIPECRKYVFDAYRYHAMPMRQPSINSEHAKLRTKATLVAVGETSLFALNEAKQKWEVVCNAPLEDNYPYPFAVITINNYLYVLGARRTASEEYRTCYRFSPYNLEWTQLASLLHDRSRFGAALVDNYIYIFGGFEGFKRSNRVYLNTIERYSIENDQWEVFTNEGPQMSSISACTFHNLIYFGGGKNNNWNKVNDFYCINVEKKSIEKKASMLTARTTHQLTVCNDRMIVIGGFDDAGNGILSIEMYDHIADQWSVLTNIPGSLSKTWPQSLGVLAEGTRFYVGVFHTPNTFKITQKGYYYDLNSNIWSEAPVVHERARYCLTCCLSFPSKIYTFNGANDEIIINHGQNNDSLSTVLQHQLQQQQLLMIDAAVTSTPSSSASTSSIEAILLNNSSIAGNFDFLNENATTSEQQQATTLLNCDDLV